jgi:hypothetical protein
MRRNLTNGLLLAVFGGACMVSAPAGAETYKWTDAEGKIHYTDQPPPANAKELGTLKSRKPSAPTKSGSPPAGDKGAPAPRSKTPAEQEADFRKRQVEAAEREAAEKKKAEEAETKKKNCDLAQAQLKMYQAGGRITTPGPQGEREYMSEAQVAQEIERVKKQAADLCK